MRIRFEKVSDVAFDYCHLDVFVDDAKSPFMDVSLEKDRSIRFNIYANRQAVSLTKEEWEMLLAKADDFAKKEVENEKAFKKWE